MLFLQLTVGTKSASPVAGEAAPPDEGSVESPAPPVAGKDSPEGEVESVWSWVPSAWSWAWAATLPASRVGQICEARKRSTRRVSCHLHAKVAAEKRVVNFMMTRGNESKCEYSYKV